MGYKKAWFEYDGTVQLGVDASKDRFAGRDATNVVTIASPNAQVLGLPQDDEITLSDIHSEIRLLIPIATVNQPIALKEAQKGMKESAEANSTLMNGARERAKTLLSQYVTKIGDLKGVKYEVQFRDAE